MTPDGNHRCRDGMLSCNCQSNRCTCTIGHDHTHLDWTQAGRPKGHA